MSIKVNAPFSTGLQALWTGKAKVGTWYYHHDRTTASSVAFETQMRPWKFSAAKAYRTVMI
jgi:hypothetical protein